LLGARHSVALMFMVKMRHGVARSQQ